jgi:hypothetical protein
VKALADHGTLLNDDGADHRIRRRLSPPAASEVERPAHERAIVLAVGRGVLVRHSRSDADAKAE